MEPRAEPEGPPHPVGRGGTSIDDFAVATEAEGEPEERRTWWPRAKCEASTASLELACAGSSKETLLIDEIHRYIAFP